jgi:hypothetical protein
MGLMKPLSSVGLWLSLILGTALAVCAFIGLAYLLHWGLM